MTQPLLGYALWRALKSSNPNDLIVVRDDAGAESFDDDARLVARLVEGLTFLDLPRRAVVMLDLGELETLIRTCRHHGHTLTVARATVLRCRIAD